MREEIWKDVVDWEGLYQVSSHGTVRSVDRKIESVNQYDGFLMFRRGKILSAHPSGSGYLHVGLRDGKRKKTARVHDLVAAVFHGPKPQGYHVHHLDGDKLNNRAVNLVYVEGFHHNSFEHKGMFAGEKNCKARLTTSEVVEIKRMLSEGKTRRFLAEKFDVHPDTIADIDRKKTWRTVNV